jgi:flagellar biosynthesis/type III secretory pathway chaperone
MIQTPASTNDIEDLKQNLDQEIAVHNELGEYLEQKRQAIIHRDLDALARIDTELERLTQNIGKLEQERMRLMFRMGRQSQTLREFIASLASTEDSTMLNRSREKLVSTTKEIKRMSHNNRDLLSQSIRLVEQSVRLIASLLAPEGAAYSKYSKGKQHGSQNGSNELSYWHSSTINREA